MDSSTGSFRPDIGSYVSQNPLPRQQSQKPLSWQSCTWFVTVWTQFGKIAADLLTVTCIYPLWSLLCHIFTYCIFFLRRYLSLLHKLIIGSLNNLPQTNTSNMAIRIKTNSPSEDCVIDKNSGKQDPKFFNHNQEQDTHIFPLGSYSNETNPFRVGSLDSSPDHSSSDNRTFFNTSKVEQWVANSVSGSDSFVQLAPYDQSELLTGNHPSLSGAGAEVPESFSFSRSSLSHVSLQHSAQFAAPDGPLISYNEPCAVTVAEPCPEISPGFEPEDADILRDLWPYQSPLDDDSFYSNSAAVHATIGNEDFGLCSEWTLAPAEDFLHATVPGASRTAGWSSLLVVDPSESSYSQSSMVVPQPNTPLSPATQDDGWCATQRGIPEDEFRIYPQLSLREHVPSPPLYGEGMLDMRFVKHLNTVFTQSDQVYSNLKPHVLPSISSSRSETWPNNHTATTVPNQRRPIEGEIAPREHKLYHVGPGENGLYYCPFAGSDDCTHKPEKLKCNYE